jgi:hypothetical protein
MRKDGDGQPLVFLARRLRYCEIGDPRDGLAGMLSFTNDVDDPKTPFNLDYSLSADQSTFRLPFGVYSSTRTWTYSAKLRTNMVNSILA